MKACNRFIRPLNANSVPDFGLGALKAHANQSRNGQRTNSRFAHLSAKPPWEAAGHIAGEIAGKMRRD